MERWDWKTKRRDHRCLVPLCPDHHRGHDGVHGLGSEAKFLARWGLDLVKWSMIAWEMRGVPDGSFWRYGVTQCNDIAKAHALRQKRTGYSGPDDEIRA
jgi:hypothetical protein